MTKNSYFRRALQFVFSTAVMGGVAQAAVDTLPLAPEGYQWGLFRSGLVDSQIVDTSSVKAAILADLSLAGNSSAPFSSNIDSSRVLSLNAFGSSEPESYLLGDRINLVTSNYVTASLSIIAPAGVLNPDGDYILIENSLSGVQITSASGNTFPGSDLANGLANTSTVLTSSAASSSVDLRTSITEIQGEEVGFTFSISNALEINTPFGGTVGSSGLTYFVDSSVDLSLRRDTSYNQFQLVQIDEESLVVPEPSGILLLSLSSLIALKRRR